MIAGVLVAAGSGFVGWRVGWRLATSHYRERLETQKVIIDDLRNKQEARLNVSSSANAAASREEPDIPHLVPDFIYDGYDETSNDIRTGPFSYTRICAFAMAPAALRRKMFRRGLSFSNTHIDPLFFKSMQNGRTLTMRAGEVAARRTA
jgi:hypothetical protein